MTHTMEDPMIDCICLNNTEMRHKALIALEEAKRIEARLLSFGARYKRVDRYTWVLRAFPQQRKRI